MPRKPIHLHSTLHHVIPILQPHCLLIKCSYIAHVYTCTYRPIALWCNGNIGEDAVSFTMIDTQTYKELRVTLLKHGPTAYSSAPLGCIHNKSCRHNVYTQVFYVGHITYVYASCMHCHYTGLKVIRLLIRYARTASLQSLKLLII